MNEEIVSDFWKEKMILLQRQNSRAGEPVADLEKAFSDIEKIQLIYPGMKSDIDKGENYISWELFVSETFHIRLYIQRQTKISFYGKTKTGFEKIADAKLFNDPFPSVLHFLKHFDSYDVELYHVQDSAMKVSMQKKIEGEFIKSLLLKKYSDKIYSIELKKDSWFLTVDEKTEKISLNSLLGKNN